MFNNFHAAFSDKPNVSLFKKLRFDINPATLFIIEIVYNIKFIIVNDDMSFDFSLLPDFENPIKEDRNKYINMISDGDPHFFIFVEKRGNQYIPLDVENINGDMTNMVTIDTMTLSMLESLKKLYQEFNDIKQN